MRWLRRIEKLWLDPETTEDRITGWLGKVSIESAVALIPATIACATIMAVFRFNPDLQILGMSELTFTVAGAIYSFTIYSAYCTIISPDSDPYAIMTDNESGEEPSAEEAGEQSDLESFDN